MKSDPAKKVHHFRFYPLARGRSKVGRMVYNYRHKKRKKVDFNACILLELTGKGVNLEEILILLVKKGIKFKREKYPVSDTFATSAQQQ